MLIMRNIINIESWKTKEESNKNKESEENIEEESNIKSKENIEKGYAQQYFEEESVIKENFKSMMDNSQVVVE